MSIAMELSETMMMSIRLYCAWIRSSVNVNGIFCEVHLPYGGQVPNLVCMRVSLHSVNGPYMLEIVKTVVCKMIAHEAQGNTQQTFSLICSLNS